MPLYNTFIRIVLHTHAQVHTMIYDSIWFEKIASVRDIAETTHVMTVSVYFSLFFFRFYDSSNSSDDEIMIKC